MRAFSRCSLRRAQTIYRCLHSTGKLAVRSSTGCHAEALLANFCVVCDYVRRFARAAPRHAHQAGPSPKRASTLLLLDAALHHLQHRPQGRFHHRQSTPGCHYARTHVSSEWTTASHDNTQSPKNPQDLPSTATRSQAPTRLPSRRSITAASPHTPGTRRHPARPRRTPPADPPHVHPPGRQRL